MQAGHDHDQGDPGGHDHAGHQHGHGHGHGHGHANDRGLAAVRRYLRQTPRLWRSAVNDAVVARLAPIPGERALDIGAGMGAGVVAAARTGATVTAVEPTPFLRRILRARGLLNRARSRIVVADGAAENLPVGDRTVDVAWAVNAMHHWVDAEVAAGELARVLRPGGRILLIDEDFTDPAHPDARTGEHGPHRHGFSAVEAETMAGLLRGAGLVEVDAAMGTMAGRPALIVSASAGI